MVQNVNNSLEEKLNEFIGKNVIITQDGFLKNKYSIHKLKYFIEYEDNNNHHKQPDSGYCCT